MSAEAPTPAPAPQPTVPAPAPMVPVPATPPVVVNNVLPAPEKPSRLRRFWNALKNVSLIMSMIVNLILIIVIFVLLNQVGNIKLTLAAVLGQLDTAFVGLGASTIQDTIQINQQVPVRFDLPLEQDTSVVTTGEVPINAPATFSLGPYGMIYGNVSLSLPPGTRLPVHLSLVVPVSNTIAVAFDQPVSINLKEKGLGPVVVQLRSALGPVIHLIRQLPDRFVILSFD